jgi:intein/homing endonuclease
MKYKYNLKAFEEITNESAYFLGLLYADGNLSDRGRVTLNLSIKDIELVYKFINFLGTDKPLSIIKKTNSVSFSFQNKVITKQLINLGLKPRKSLILKFPKFIDSLFLKDFIRGYFDGDGSVSLKKRKTTSNIRVHLVGTFDMLFNIQKHLIKLYNINETKIGQITKNKNTFQLEIRNKKDVIIFKNFLYDGSNLYLERKKDIFDVDTTLKNVDSNTTSRYRNVCFNKRTKRWRAAYYLNNIRKEKSFPTEEEAFNFLNSEDYFL